MNRVSEMPEPILRQLSSFLVFLVGGLLIGCLFDSLRILRATLRPRGPSSFFLDLSFWLILTLVIFPLLMLGTSGELRLFIWLGIFLGLTYYFLLLSRLLHPLLLGLTRILFALRQWTARPPRAGQNARTDLEIKQRRTKHR